MNIVSTLRLNAMLAVDFFAGIFDRGLDGAIAAFLAAENKLSAYQNRLDARIARELEAQDASSAREQAIISREQAAREASMDRVADMAASFDRAAQVRSRINALLG